MLLWRDFADVISTLIQFTLSKGDYSGWAWLSLKALKAGLRLSQEENKKRNSSCGQSFGPCLWSSSLRMIFSPNDLPNRPQICLAIVHNHTGQFPCDKPHTHIIPPPGSASQRLITHFKFVKPILSKTSNTRQGRLTIPVSKTSINLIEEIKKKKRHVFLSLQNCLQN